MERAHPMLELMLTTDERDTLERWARRPTTVQALAERARMILACVDRRQPHETAWLTALWLSPLRAAFARGSTGPPLIEQAVESLFARTARASARPSGASRSSIRATCSFGRPSID